MISFLQRFFQCGFFLQHFIKIVRPLLATMCINGWSKKCIFEVHFYPYILESTNAPNNSSLVSPVIFPFQRSWWSCHHAWYCVVLDLPARHYLELLIQPSPTRPVWQPSILAPNSRVCHCGWFYRTWDMRASSIEYNTAVIW